MERCISVSHSLIDIIEFEQSIWSLLLFTIYFFTCAAQSLNSAHGQVFCHSSVNSSTWEQLFRIWHLYLTNSDHPYTWTGHFWGLGANDNTCQHKKYVKYYGNCFTLYSEKEKQFYVLALLLVAMNAFWFCLVE